jgi:tetratricopeptide (TPR) repeat protein
MGGPVDWSWPLAVLAVGLVLGLVLVTRRAALARSAPESAAPTSLERRDLEGKRQALLQQLRELDDTASKRTPAQLARERYALELEAAQAWRELDRLGARAAVKEGKEAKASAKARAAGAEPAVPAAVGNSGLRGFLWGAGSAVAVGLLALFVTNALKPRGQSDSLTGNLPARGGAPPGGAEEAVSPEEQQEEQRLREVLAKNPDDHDARIDLAQLHLGRRDLMAVWNDTQYVLQRVPGHPRALSYQALVRLAMGQGEAAVTMLKQAQGAAPNLLEPSLHLALVYARLGRMKEAEATITDAQRRFPEQSQRLGELLAQMREVGTDPPGEAAGGTPAAPRAPGGATPAERGVAGVIELDPRLAGSVPAGALVFVTARAAGVAQGPPVAVKRLPASFPLRFELSSADSMMGQPLPERLRLEARLDADGDPLSRGPSDFAARLDGVAVGRADLKLVLKQ